MPTVYGKPNCPACRSTTRRLDKHGINYTYIDVTVDENAYQTVVDLGYKELPVVTHGSDHWSGFRLDQIDALTN